MRLAKYLASAGVASRRASEELIRAGRVAVGGEPVTDPARDAGPQDEITVDGRPVKPAAALVVYALNKPSGVVSTARDTHGRPTVVSLIPTDVRLYPVGRLDIDTTGLILLTNDGELAHRLTHPRYEVEKTYRARVANPPIRAGAVNALRRGVELDDGPTARAQVTRVAPDTLELTIHEGRNRQIKRMCAQVGHPVRGLERIAFGAVTLGSVAPGDYRKLSALEVEALSAGSTAHRGAASSPSARRTPARGRATPAARRRGA